MKDLVSISLFVRVVQLGSLSAVAREMGALPSSVSRQIASLEEHLDSRLFQRTTRTQSLTEAGAVFYDYALRLTQELEEAKHAVNRLSNSVTGTLQIAMEADFSQVFVAPILPEFFERYPGIRVRMNLNTKILDLVESGTDLAIRMGHLSDSSLIARKIAVSRSVICCSPQYLKKYEIPQCPEDLSTLNCMSFKTDIGSNSWRFQKQDSITEVVITGAVNVNSLGFLKQMALAHQGVSMMPLWMIQNELASGQLMTLLDEHQLIPNTTPIHALFPSSNMLAPKVRVFVDYLIEKLSDSNLS
jgi:DNA-binding transcriptional LysR family regulator|tara:strand:- start:3790 stop:4692 length:903 start_codon:yes stop_codon:yes gene_type:complete